MHCCGPGARGFRILLTGSNIRKQDWIIDSRNPGLDLSSASVVAAGYKVCINGTTSLTWTLLILLKRSEKWSVDWWVILNKAASSTTFSHAISLFHRDTAWVCPMPWQKSDTGQKDAFSPMSWMRVLAAAFQQPAASAMKGPFESWEARRQLHLLGYDWGPSGTTQHFPFLFKLPICVYVCVCVCVSVSVCLLLLHLSLLLPKHHPSTFSALTSNLVLSFQQGSV